MRVFALAVLVVFTVFVTVFAASANKNEVRTMPKWAWVLVCLLFPLIGGVLYLLVGRPVGGAKQQTRIVAPDDDPEFLRKLNEQIRKQKEQDQRADKAGQKDGGDDPVGHSRAPFSASSRSTRSWPDSSHDPSAIITITAVMPKLMTMAVSTSACGSGSV